MATYALFVLMLSGLGFVLYADGVEISEDILNQIKMELRKELCDEITQIKEDLNNLKDENRVLKQELLLCCAEKDSVNIVHQTAVRIEQDHDGDDISVTGESTESGLMRTRKIPGRVHRLVTPTTVAFTAFLSQHALNLGFHQTVPFDQTEINIGEAFDTILHVFICPVNGVYFFLSSVLCVDHGLAETEIVKDGSRLCMMLAHGAYHGAGHDPTGKTYDQGANAVITTCNQGQRVWVRVHAQDTHEIDGNVRATTFSGFLIHEI